MPKLSIIVPVYNVKKYIDKCITSILGQTFTDYELILVDDGSTDGSGYICETYTQKDSRIKVFHQENQGQSVARNFALKIAKGEYVGFVDSDDWVELEMFAEMMAAAENKNADVAVCRLQTVNETGGDIIEVIGYGEQLLMDRWKATSEILKDDVMRSYPVNKIYRRELFEGIEYPVSRYFEDTSTIYKLIYKANKIITIPYIGYNYRINSNSTCNNQNIDYQKQVKREYDNALAFGERYMFSKTDERLSEIRITCADFGYMRMRSFLHLQVHKGLELSQKQKKDIDTIMKSFEWQDLCHFSLMQKMDMIGYKYCKPLYYLYLKVLAKIHPMSRDL